MTSSNEVYNPIQEHLWQGWPYRKSAFDVSTTPYIGCMNEFTNTMLTPGYSRVILNRSISCNFVIGVVPGTGESQTYKLTIGYDRTPRFVFGPTYQLTYTDLYETVSPLSNPNLSNSHRFDILYSRTAYINASSKENSRHVFNVSLDLIDYPTVLSNNMYHTTGSLFLACVTDHIPGVGAATMNFYSLLVYKNMV